MAILLSTNIAEVIFFLFREREIMLFTSGPQLLMWVKQLIKQYALIRSAKGRK